MKGASSSEDRADSEYAVRADPLPVRRSHVLVLLRVSEMPLRQAEDWRYTSSSHFKRNLLPSGDFSLAV